MLQFMNRALWNSCSGLADVISVHVAVLWTDLNALRAVEAVLYCCIPTVTDGESSFVFNTRGVGISSERMPDICFCISVEAVA